MHIHTNQAKKSACHWTLEGVRGSYKSPSDVATHFCMAIRIRVNQKYDTVTEKERRDERINFIGFDHFRWRRIILNSPLKLLHRRFLR
jgi:hypothetical protein